MYRIGKTFKFSASHQLTALPESHQCARLHGHNYFVELTFVGSDLTEDEGWLLDYGDLGLFRSWLNKEFDHQHLNFRLPANLQPTAENLAKYIFEAVYKLDDLRIPENAYLEKVRVQETENTFAEYFGD